MAFKLFNATDGIFADPRSFPTHKAAEQAASEFPKRYERQGYYLTADGDRIDPQDVALEIVPDDGTEPECRCVGGEA